MRTNNNVEITKSGVFIRRNPGVGILTYSPYSGSCFISPENTANALIQWLTMETKQPPSEQHLKTLGPGWMIPKNEANYPIPHLLPKKEEWQFLYFREPISINWMITGQCPLACQYCYAEDLMRGKEKEPSLSDVRKIARNILSYRPLVVIITGGEPLLSPFLKDIFPIFEQRAGIVLDTSGIGLTDAHIDLFKKYKVFVRVSLDSERPFINNELRRYYSRTGRVANSQSKYTIDAICKLIDAQIDTGIQSVVTYRNRSDLEALGDKLFKLGISAWRILLMVETPSNSERIRILWGKSRGIKRFQNQVIGRILEKQKKDWCRQMTVQIVSNANPNSVIVVGPSGIFYTESNIPLAGKVAIDSLHPTRPSLYAINEKVDMHAHIDRYLNIIRRQVNEGGL